MIKPTFQFSFLQLIIQVNKFNSKDESGFISKQPRNVHVITAANCSQSNSNCLTWTVCRP